MSLAAAPPFTVLMTADTLGGVFSYALELGAELVARGARVVLATMGPPLSAAQREQILALEERGPRLELHEGHCRLEWMPDPWKDVEASGRWLLALENAVRPDVVHLNGYAHAALPFRAPRLCVAHSCVLSWFEAVRRSPAPPAYARYAEEVARGLSAAEAVVAVSQAMAGALDRHYGHGATHVVHNGVAPERYRPRPQAMKEPLVLAAGRLWDEAKNVLALAQVAPRLRWPVRLAGPTRGPDGREVDLGDLPTLGCLGPQALVDWLSRAAVYAAPARYEPFGLLPLEAALSGCALVLGDIPSLREVWGEAALYVDPDDPDDLARALDRLADEPPLRVKMASRALAHARRYHVRHMADHYQTLYAALAGHRLAGAYPTSNEAAAGGLQAAHATRSDEPCA